jgi:hypothetical protein
VVGQRAVARGQQAAHEDGPGRNTGRGAGKVEIVSRRAEPRPGTRATRRPRQTPAARTPKPTRRRSC